MSGTPESWFPPPIPPPPGGSGPPIPEAPASVRRSTLLALAFAVVAIVAGGTGLVVGRVTASDPEPPAPAASDSAGSGFADDEQSKVSVQGGHVTSPEVTFSYPVSWVQVPSDARSAPGLQRWSVRLEPDTAGSFVVVYADNSAYDGSAFSESDLKAIVQERVRSLAASAKGTISVEPRLEQPGAESFWGAEITWTDNGSQQTASLHFSFHRHLLIEVYCLSDAAHAQSITDGCNQVLQSLHVTAE